MVETLIALGASVVERNLKGETPLGYAASARSFEDFKHIWNCARSTELHDVSLDLIEDLIIAAEASGNDLTVKFLTSLGCDGGMTTPADGHDPASHEGSDSKQQNRDHDLAELGLAHVPFALHFASVPEVPFDSFKLLVDRGKGLDSQDSDGDTPLHILSRSEDSLSLQKLQLIVASQAATNLLNKKTYTPIMVAISHNNQSGVRILLDGGASLTIKSAGGYTAMHWAAKWGMLDCIHILLEKVEDLEDRIIDGSTALILAATRGHWNTTKLLLGHGANPDARSLSGKHFLYEVIQPGGGEMLKYYLEKFPDVSADIEDDNGFTPLIRAAVYANIETFRLLLKHGANFGSRNCQHMLAFSAGESPYPEVRDELLKHELDWNTKAKRKFLLITLEGATPLHVSVARHPRETWYMTSFLLDNKLAEINSCAADGITPLHLSILENSIQSFDILLKHGADANMTTSSSGDNALHVAVKFGRSCMFEALIKHGCDLSRRHKDGHTPHELAIILDNINMANDLQALEYQYTP